MARMYDLVTVWVLFLTGSAGVPCSGADTREGPIPTTLPEALIGTWKQEDGGIYLQLSEDSANFYHHSEFCCYKDEPASGRPLAESYKLYILSDDNSKLTLLRSDFWGRFDEFFGRDGFTRVPALPPETIHEPSLDERFRDPTFVFDLVWHHFDEQFPFFEIRGFDWAEKYRRYRPNISRRSTDEELYGALTGMLTGLGDSHTRIYWEEREQPFKSGRARVLDYLEDAFERQDQYGDQSGFNGFWDRTVKARVASELVDGQLRESANVIGWGHLEGDVGYIRLDFLTGFGQPGSSKEEQVELLEREMDRIIEEFQDRRAIIIDLSFNQGGFDAAGAVMASRFADRRRHVLSMYSAGQDPGSAREFSVSPGGPRQYTGPVVVLTSNITVSAGETLTLMLKAFPHVRHVGEPTRGCLSSFLNKGMPNAFHVTMSNQFWVSPSGRIYEGSGIQPDVEFPVFSEEDLFGSYPEAVQRALKIATQSRR